MILEDSLTSREMKAVEMNAEYIGVSKLQLMENAGRAVAEETMGRFGKKSKARSISQITFYAKGAKKVYWRIK